MDGVGRIFSGEIARPRDPDGTRIVPDSNDLLFLQHDSGAGQAEANTAFDLNPPRRKFVLMKTPGSGAPIIFFHHQPVDGGIVAGGTLTPTGKEQWVKVLPREQLLATAGASLNGSYVEFCKPISRLYCTHGDFGTGVIYQILASDDVEIGAGPR